jgi:hypothetical protein
VPAEESTAQRVAGFALPLQHQRPFAGAGKGDRGGRACRPAAED